MPKISLCIPTLHVGDNLERCIESFKGQYDELIVVDDKDKSLAFKQNKAMRLATGDFLIVSNDDVISDTGTLSDLCREGAVLSPRVNGGIFKVFHGHMFCLPRKIYAECGGFDESYPGVYYIDAELWYRLKQLGYDPGIQDSMNVIHDHPATTIKTLDSKQTSMSEGESWFVSKWGRGALHEVGC
jgi:glycosyltransferase involved in cell wall biosynthesis